MRGRGSEGPTTHPYDENTPEQRLIERAKQDPEAFGILYDQNFDKIYAYVQRKTGDRQLAEDLTSETFTKALANISKFQVTGQPFAAWLYRIASNLVTDYYRSRKVIEPHNDELQIASSGPTPEDAALLLDDQQAVSRAIRSLSPDQQDVVLMRFSGGLKLKEIAKAVGKTEGAVKALMFRALGSLKGKLTESGVRP